MKVKKLLAAFLAAMMTIGLVPITAMAATADETDWDVSKSKTATELDDNWCSDVTLSLPSAEEELKSDIVFVIDKSDCQEEVMSKFSVLIDELEDVENSTNADIDVGVIVFKGNALGLFDGEIINISDANNVIKNIISKVDIAIKKAGDDFINSGTNLHSGLTAAKNMLDRYGRDDSKKYIITITDGMTYYWNDENEDTCAIYNYEWQEPYGGNTAGWHKVDCLFYGWQKEYGIMSNYVIPEEGIDWDDYISDIRERMKADGDYYTCRLKDVYEKTTKKDYSGLRYFEGENAINEFTKAGFKYVGKGALKKHVLGIERSIVECIDTYQYLINSKYKCYTINPKYSVDAFPGLFTSKLNELAGVTGNVDFNTVGRDILYAVDAGSIVIDEIGEDSEYNFNFVNDIDELKLTVGDEKLDCEKIDGYENRYGFGKTVNGGYRFELEYFPDGATNNETRGNGDVNGECLVWYINEKISNFNRVSLTYKVELVEKDTEPGTHTVYTNKKAVLYPMNTLGEYGDSEKFDRPQLEYKIKEKDNGDSGYELPEKHIERPEEKPELETQEHFQYISGYPDGTVRPNANITRAEVATIFYRLLSDDSRNAYFSTVENFSDVQSTDWYLKAVATLTNAGILHGDEGKDTYRPNDSITRAEFATIVSFFDDLSYTGEDRFSDIAGHWANAYINSASANGWINGYPNGTYNPDAAITRAEAMTIINNVLGREVDGEGLHWKTKMWPDNPNYAWYYYEVLEATNYHDYVRESEDEAEEWTDIRPNKVWNEGAAN